MSPRETTVADLATLASRGVRFSAARVTATGIVARVLVARTVCEAHGDPWRGVRALREQRLLLETHVARMLALAADDDLVACDVCGGREVRCCARCSGVGGVPRYAAVRS